MTPRSFLATAAVAAAALGLAAPAVAAPTGAGNADTAIRALEDQGNRVVVTRLSQAPLDQASIVSITHGPVLRQGVPFATSQGDNFRSVTTQTVYVAVE
ncbi:hypothetical protein FK535_15920 [Mycolicibacterium sp. 018/SC-01/001]|uniref:hypothetical protein n=1 Tax=Mycolicibacterium sp. 018/SC-01/001 TaxID=2592069 RepID=UPI00117C7424|nr:hypothetical protein [Mycolicibacterium sp. 018/SC-01/001]TRW81831.1 hypothetical protein FK535_15920 [Mycolicibacterium sp. 018/SC-01/001]